MTRQSFKCAIVVTIVLSFLYNAGYAQSDAQSYVISTAVPFLRLNPDARSGAMGDMGIATAPDANASFFNLAKTPFSKNNSGIGITYTPWLSDLGLNDVYLLSAAGYGKFGTDGNQSLSGSVRYFSLGSINFTGDNGEDKGTYRPKEYGIDLGYSRKLSKKTSLGIALRYINSSLANGYSSNSGVTVYKAGTAVAGDLSIFHNGLNAEGEGFTWGATISNLGSKIGYTNDAQNKDYIPANLGVGVAYTTVFDESNKMTFGLDLNKLLVPAAPISVTSGTTAYNDSVNSKNLTDYRSSSVISSWFKSFHDGQNQLQEIQASIGAEYTYMDQFNLRAGYFYEDPNKGNRKYFTVGVGLKYNIIGINFSYLVPSGSGVTRNPLSNTLRFGLIFDLDGENSK